MNIYISNLGAQITDDSLMATFSTFGEVLTATIARDSVTQASKGFGVIDMPNAQEAAAAIIRINGCIINGSIVMLKAQDISEIN